MYPVMRPMYAHDKQEKDQHLGVQTDGYITERKNDDHKITVLPSLLLLMLMLVRSKRLCFLL